MCTYIRKICSDKACLIGRTMEFSDKLNSFPIFMPSGFTPERYIIGGDGYKNKYACVGMTAYNIPLIIDGFNEAGLNVASLYFSGVSEYKKDINNYTVYPYEFNQLILSQCSSTEDVIRYLNEHPELNVVDDPERSMGLHWSVSDSSGRSIMIEPIGGLLIVTENPIGVCTNSPEHGWHLKNLANYVTLSTNGQRTFDFDRHFTVNINGAGSGLIGIPGDWTPASRFIRAAYFTQLSPTPENALEGMTDIFHILSTSDIVKGCIASESKSGGGDMETTQYTSCSDLSNLIYYYHTYESRAISYLKLNELIANHAAITHFTLPVSQFLIDGSLA